MPQPADIAPPDIPGLSFRAFAGSGDFAQMCVVANANFEADGIDIRRTVEDMERDYAAFTNCDPEKDVRIAEIDGTIVGYVRSMAWTQADGKCLYGQLGFVHPQWRRRGIGGALQAWMESRQRELASASSATSHEHHVFVTQTEDSRRALVEKAGYRPERHFFTMLRPTLDAIADFPLPQGFELRPAAPEHYRQIWETHLRSFADAWGYSPPTEADYEGWIKTRGPASHLWQVAWHIESNQVAGQVRTFIDDTYNSNFKCLRGWTEFISVDRPWRRRGLARAMISQSLRVQRDAGMTESALGVDADNATGAPRVYADCGFGVVKRNTVYRKPVAIATPS